MRHRPLTVLLTLVLVLGLAPAAAADSDNEEGTGTDNVEFIDNLRFTDEPRGSFAGTDLDFATYPATKGGKILPSDHPGQGEGLTERELAFVGTALDGLQVVDVTDRENPEHLATYDCAISQADVFTFTQDDRTYVAYSLDAVGQNDTSSDCHQETTEHGSIGNQGTFLIDVTDPLDPEAVSFLPMRKGTHQVTVHPSGEYLYNSAAVVVTTHPGTIEVYDIGDNATPDDPELVDELELATGLDSHDLTFNEDGTRAYSAALTHSFVIDTEDPANPEITGRIYDPAINIHHDAHKVTVEGPLGEDRDYMLIGDELAGAAGNGVCPGGGIHVYDITGELENAPVKVGAFFVPDVRPAGTGGDAGDDLTCTAHVIQVHPDEEILTVAWYNAGVRVLDYSGLGELGGAGLQVGVAGESLTPGLQEIGHRRLDDSVLWSAKSPGVEDDGSFYIYGGDIERALDTFKFTPDAEGAEEGGDWLNPDAALAKAQVNGTTTVAGLEARESAFCLLPRN